MTSTGGGGGWLGYVEAMAAASLWGSSGIFAVHLFGMGVPPESLALLRPVVGVAFLAAWALAFRRSRLRISWRAGLLLALGGGGAVGLFQLAYQTSIDAAGVPTTVALLYLAPAVVVAVSGPLLGEWPSRRRVLLAATVVVGVWLTVLGAEDVEATFGSRGLVWGVAAGLTYAAYTLFGRYASPRWGAVPTVVYSTAGACLLLAVALPALSGPIVLPSSARAWWTLVAFGVLTVGVAHFLFFDALGRVEASGVAVATALEPVVAALLATMLVAQGLEPLGWVGLVLVVAGVVGVARTAGRGVADPEGPEAPPRAPS